MVQEVKLQPVTLRSNIRTQIQIPATTPQIQLPAKAPEKAEDGDPSTCTPATQIGD